MRVVSFAVASLLLAISLPVRAGDTTVQVERWEFADRALPAIDCGSFTILEDMQGRITWKTVSSSTGALLSEMSVVQWSENFYTDPEHPELGLRSLPAENNAFRIDWTTGIAENHGAVAKIFIPGYGLAHVAGHMVIDLNTGTIVRPWDLGSWREVAAALCAYFAQ